MTKRVENPLPIPQQCDNCASPDVTFTGNEVVYGKPFGAWPYVYYCEACGAVVGCHPNTRIPLGRMADKATRKLRAQAHSVFDPLWKSKAMTRDEAYELLARHLGIPREQCHISQLNVEQLKFVIKQCSGLIPDIDKLKRRKEKKNAKRAKRNERQQQQRFYKGKRIEGPNPFFRRARRSKQDRSKDFDGD